MADDDRRTDRALENLRRSFTVRQKVGRLRRQTRVVHAVDGITASILAGEAVGYIGANGAGKSTTIKMLTGILVPTSGQSAYLRLRSGARSGGLLAREIGVVFGQRSQLWWDLPLRDSFRILGAIHRMPTMEAAARTEELVDRLGLAALAGRRRYASFRSASGCVARWPQL